MTKSNMYIWFFSIVATPSEVCCHVSVVCKVAQLGADPEEIGLAAMPGVEWPQHVDFGSLPEGAQWRFADTQEPGMMQVLRTDNISVKL